MTIPLDVTGMQPKHEAGVHVWVSSLDTSAVIMTGVKVRVWRGSGPEIWEIRAHNLVQRIPSRRAAQCDNQPANGLCATMVDGIYAPSPLHGVLPGIQTQNLLMESMFLSYMRCVNPKCWFNKLFGRLHGCSGCATSA